MVVSPPRTAIVPAKKLNAKTLPAVLALSLLAACANQQPTQTGFLGAAPLAPIEGGLAYVAPADRAQGYHAFLIDEVVFRPRAGAVQNAGEGDAEAIVDAYRTALEAAFGERFAPATEAGPGVLRVRAAITGYARTNVPLNIVSTLLIAPVSNGGASSEAEVTDSLTGEPLAALSTATNGHLFNSGLLAYYSGRDMARQALARHARDLAGRVPGPVQVATR